MRTDWNPNSPHHPKNKGKDKITVQEPKKIGLCFITHLPYRTGYHKDRFEVIEASLHSMRHGAGNVDFDLHIWDNRSDLYFREWLGREIDPTTLVLSENIGGANARLELARITRNEILSFTDDDVFFYPGWLEKELQILETYPRVGLVSGYPFSFRANSPLPLDYLGEITGQADFFVPVEWDEDHAASIMMSQEYMEKKRAGKTQVRLSYRDVDAYAQSHHIQFLARRETILPLMKWSPELMFDGNELERNVSYAGLVRLCTTDRVVKHIGNVLDPTIEKEIDDLYVIQKDRNAAISYG